MPTTPAVPDAPGVPALDWDGPPPAPPLLAQGDGTGNLGPLPGPVWGIYKDGQSVVTADVVAAMGYKQDWSLLDYPVEEGGFESYNKVNTPFDVRVRFATGGGLSDRQALLNSIASIANTLDLYDVMTPEAIYQNCNVTHYDYERRAEDGVGLLKVDVWLLEIRQTGEVQNSNSNTKSPAGASPQNDGTVQTAPATTTQVNTVTPIITGGGGGW